VIFLVSDKGKLKVAILGLTCCGGCQLEILNLLTCCGGCQLEILNLEPVLLDLVEVIELVNFPEAQSENKDGPYDVAFVEGSVTTREEIERIKNIRKESKFLVALGTCACYGGVQSIRNFGDVEEARKQVYDDDGSHIDALPATGLDEHVNVDYYMRGCPVDRSEIVDVLTSLLIGKTPEPKHYSVCVECKLAEYACLLNEGKLCMGPVTNAGCKARCPAVSVPCDGCRGPYDQANLESFIEILKEKKISVEDILRKFRMYTSWAPQYRNLKVI